MWFCDREKQVGPASSFSAQVDTMNDFAVAFGEIHRKHSWGEGMAAFNMLKTAAGFTNPIARNAVIGALATEYKLGRLPDTVVRTITAGSDGPGTGRTSRDFINTMQAVFLSLADPERPSSVYVAALVKKTTGFGATPAFFMATPEEVADPKALMAKAKAAYITIREARQRHAAVG